VSDDRVADELAALRTEVAALRALQGGGRPHGLRLQRRMGEGKARLVIRDLETNPDTQFKVHRWGAIYWLCNFPVIAWLFFAYPDVWVKWGVFITLIYSLYANLATDYGAMSSAMAAKGAGQPPVIPLEEP
jgi:hypothetical protein